MHANFLVRPHPLLRDLEDDCQILPHAQLLRRENAFDGAKEKAIVFHLDFKIVLNKNVLISEFLIG